MPGNPILNCIHSFWEHHSSFGKMIKQEGNKLITNGNLSLEEHFSLNMIQFLFVKSWHVQYILDGTSGPWVGVELLDFPVHSLVGFGGFNKDWTDVVFIEFLEEAITDGFSEGAGVGKEALNHLNQSGLLLMILYKFKKY